MRGNFHLKKASVLATIFILASMAFSPALGLGFDLEKPEKIINYFEEEYPLPPPLEINMPLEQSMMRRMSMRDFTEDSVTDKELSTVLWAAYGLRNDGELTVPEFEGINAVVIYILLEEVYKYNPINHSLVFYKEGDYRDIVGWQYHAPVQIGLCWNTDLADANLGSAECGAVGQNIYLAANAIDLGTVITAQAPNAAIEPVGLPPNEKGMAVMPLGHTTTDYNFVYRPMLISLLPKVRFSDMSLTDALKQRNEVNNWETDRISRKDLSHLIWSSYGYSYYIDQSGTNIIKRHHTIPSAHGYYPFKIYAVTRSAIYEYVYGLYNLDFWGLPVVSYLKIIKLGDFRDDIGDVTESFVENAPLIIIPVLEIEKTTSPDDLSAEYQRWIWYYEAGAAAHNVMLQATTRGLAGNIVHINNKAAICEIINLNEQNFDPMFIIPVG